MTISKSDAIRSLCPKAEFSVTGDVVKFDNLHGETQPTDSEIATEQTRLETKYTNDKYQRDRASEYPSVVDQLDKIYHSGVNAWKADIKAIKDKYPKS